MSTALSLYTPQEQVALAADVWPLANRLSKTEFVPKPLRDRPEAVMACMMKGSELGIPLMQSLSAIHIIEGRPTMSAELMRAVVQSKGHEIWVEESTSTRCVIVGRRAGSDRDQKFVFTIDDARAAGLLGKQVWKSWPAQMLIARASGVLCRTVFADCLAGISYSKEELEDGDFETVIVEHVETPSAVQSKPTARARQNATRGAAKSTPDVPESPAAAPRGERPPLPGEEDIVDAEVVPEDDNADVETEQAPADVTPADDFPPYVDPDPPSETRSGATMSGPARIAMMMSAHGVESRDGKLAAVAQIIGRTVTSSKDLTADEMSAVIRHLDELGEGVDFEFADIPPTAEPTPVQPPARSTDDWTGDEWRTYLGKLRPAVKITEAITAARRIHKDHGGDGSIPTMDDITGKGIGEDLMGWAEDLAASRSAS